MSRKESRDKEGCCGGPTRKRVGMQRGESARGCGGKRKEEEGRREGATARVKEENV